VFCFLSCGWTWCEGGADWEQTLFGSLFMSNLSKQASKQANGGDNKLDWLLVA